MNVGEVGFLADFNVVDVTLFVDEHGVGDGFHIDTFCEFWMKHERAGEGAVEVHFGAVLPLAHVGVFLSGFHGKHRNPSFGDHLVVGIDGGFAMGAPGRRKVRHVGKVAELVVGVREVVVVVGRP